MPITPGCQPSPATTMAGAAGIEVGARDSMAATAASRICALDRLALGVQRVELLRRAPRASPGSSVESSRAPRSERPMRPPALIRGPRMKPAWKTLAAALGAGDLHQRVRGPGLAQPDITFSPCAASARLKPTSGSRRRWRPAPPGRATGAGPARGGSANRPRRRASRFSAASSTKVTPGRRQHALAGAAVRAGSGLTTAPRARRRPRASGDGR